MRALTRSVVVLASCVAVSCSSSSGSPTTGSLDGKWDITAAGRGAIGPSEMTIGGGSANGFVAGEGEGKADRGAPGCIRTKDRTEFNVNAQGNTLTGTLTDVRQWSGSGCPADRTRVLAISGMRTRALPASDTDLNGDWTLSSGEGGRPTLITISGLMATLMNPTLSASVAGGVASVTGNRDLQFAARKR